MYDKLLSEAAIAGSVFICLVSPHSWGEILGVTALKDNPKLY